MVRFSINQIFLLTIIIVINSNSSICRRLGKSGPEKKSTVAPFVSFFYAANNNSTCPSHETVKRYPHYILIHYSSGRTLIRSFICNELHRIDHFLEGMDIILDNAVACETLPISWTHAHLDYSMFRLKDPNPSACSGSDKIFLFYKDFPLFLIWHCYKYHSPAHQHITIGIYFYQMMSPETDVLVRDYNYSNFTTTISDKTIIAKRKFMGNKAEMQTHCSRLIYEDDFILSMRSKIIIAAAVVSIVMGIFGLLVYLGHRKYREIYPLEF